MLMRNIQSAFGILIMSGPARVRWYLMMLMSWIEVTVTSIKKICEIYVNSL